MITLIISNEKMDDIMKIVKCFEDSCLLIKCVSKTVKMKQKRRRFLSILIGASLLRNLLTLAMQNKIPGHGVMRPPKITTRASQDF